MPVEDVADLAERLEDAAEVRARFLRAGPITKKGFRFASYSFQQNLFQSAANPAVGWGVFALATLSGRTCVLTMIYTRCPTVCP